MNTKQDGVLGTVDDATDPTSGERFSGEKAATVRFDRQETYAPCERGLLTGLERHVLTL